MSISILTDFKLYPEEIRQSRVWLSWGWEPRRNARGVLGWTKVPLDVHGYGYAKTNDPATWATSEEAIAAYRNAAVDGVGHARVEDQVFVDLDGCVVDGRTEPWAEEVLDGLKDTYAEFSPSNGIHIITRGNLPPGKRQFNFGDRPHHGIAFYDGSRYFTVTGKRISAHSGVRESPALLRIWEQYCVGRKTASLIPRTTSIPDNARDQQLIERACRSGDRRFRQLWAGNRDGYPTPSEADWALLEKLAFWTGGNAERMERLFGQSGLARDKWESRSDYRERTIQRVLERTTDAWKGEE